MQIATYDVVARSVNDEFPLPSVVASKVYVDLNRPAAETRWNMLVAAKFRCAYCGKRFPPHELTFDHVIPRARGGSSRWAENLVVADARCNMLKGCRTPKEAGMRLLHSPYRPTQAELNAIARKFLPEMSNMHRTWIDFLYWGAKLEGD